VSVNVPANRLDFSLEIDNAFSESHGGKCPRP
jgi:hypothetical protein